MNLVICKSETFVTDDVPISVLVADVVVFEQDNDSIAAAMAQVSPQRRAKAEAFRFRRGQALSLGAALLLDRLLQPYGLRERDMRYTENEHGRPSFADHPEILFSISHSGTRVAVAMAKTASFSFGIDIQAPTRRQQSLYRRVLSAEELQRMATLSQDGQDRLFQQLWTHKEAYAKALGTGLLEPYPSPPPSAILHELDIDAYHLALCVIKPH